MQLKPLPTEIDTKDLLSLLETTEERDIETTEDEVMNFISFYNIKSGTNEVPRHAILNLFRAWSKSIPKMSRQAFSIKFNSFFPQVVRNQQVHYLLSKDSIEVNKDYLAKISRNKLDKVKVTKNQRHFEQFLSELPLEPGNRYISLQTAYLLYSNWKRILTRAVFYRFIKIYFKEKRSVEKQIIWIGINQNKLTKEVRKFIDEKENKKKPV